MMNSPSMYSVNQLLKARQDGVPDYVVVPMLQKAMAQQQASQRQAALQGGANSPPPVADQILGAAQHSVMQDHMARQEPESRGIDALPSGIDEGDYKHGGIIAFNGEDGSDVELPAIVNRHKNIFGQSKNDVPKDYTDVQANVADARRLIDDSYSHFDNPDDFVTKWRGKGASDLPTYKKNARESLKKMGWEEGNKLDLKDAKDVNRMLSVIAKQEMGAHVSPDKWDAVAAGKYKIGEGVPPASAKGIASLPEAQRVTAAFPAAPEDHPAPFTEEEATPEFQDKRLHTYMGEDPHASAREARLSKRESELASDKDSAMWRAVMKAGLATMGGKSPNALANISEGAMSGLDAYGTDRKELHKEEGTLMDMRDTSEQAQYARDQGIKKSGWEAANTSRAANTANAAANTNARYQHGLEAAKFNQKGEENAVEAKYKGNIGDYYSESSPNKLAATQQTAEHNAATTLLAEKKEWDAIVNDPKLLTRADKAAALKTANALYPNVEALYRQNSGPTPPTQPGTRSIKEMLVPVGGPNSTTFNWKG